MSYTNYLILCSILFGLRLLAHFNHPQSILNVNIYNQFIFMFTFTILWLRVRPLCQLTNLRHIMLTSLYIDTSFLTDVNVVPYALAHKFVVKNAISEFFGLFWCCRFAFDTFYAHTSTTKSEDQLVKKMNFTSWIFIEKSIYWLNNCSIHKKCNKILKIEKIPSNKGYTFLETAR